ncbi:MAG TPA: hypothetical protein VFS15_04280, partial [Kofleriaceae bacterium]|nr:hypothetical protein [Kofleriaceae bacterium]
MSTVDTPKANGNGTGHDKANGKNGSGGKQTRGAGAERLDQRELLAALRSFKRGNFDVRLRENMTGVDGQIAECFNELVSMVKTIKDESQEVCAAVGRDGQAGKRMRRFGTSGGWSEYIASVNQVIEDLSG